MKALSDLLQRNSAGEAFESLRHETVNGKTVLHRGDDVEQNRFLLGGGIRRRREALDESKDIDRREVRLAHPEFDRGDEASDVRDGDRQEGLLEVGDWGLRRRGRREPDDEKKNDQAPLSRRGEAVHAPSPPPTYRTELYSPKLCTYSSANGSCPHQRPSMTKAYS